MQEDGWRPEENSIGISYGLKQLVYPTAYTLHPTPYTIHPTPFSLHPTPSIHNLKPQTFVIIKRDTLGTQVVTATSFTLSTPLAPSRTVFVCKTVIPGQELQGHLAHKKQSAPLGPP